LYKQFSVATSFDSSYGLEVDSVCNIESLIIFDVHTIVFLNKDIIDLEQSHK